MKRQYSILATALLISMGAIAQKDEFKTLKKIYEKSTINPKDVLNYKAALTTATPLVVASNEDDTTYLNFYNSSLPLIEMVEAMGRPENKVNPQNALKYFTPEKIAEFSKSTNSLLAYEKKTGKQVLTGKIQQLIVLYKPNLLTYAVSLVDQKRYSDASKVLYSIYELDSTDAEKLYYAANYSINANDYPTALKYYKILKDINYSGEKVNYRAVSKVSDKVDYFATKAERNQAIKLGTHTDPSEEKETSKRGEIYKNIALILVADGKTNEAKSAIAEARIANPDDLTLVVSEADIYLKTNDTATYKKLINEVLEKDPNNADLVYNLGVVSGQNKDNVNAEKYYLRAIQLKPDYSNAYLNLSALRIDESQAILESMNKLGMSASDSKKYDVLKVKRDTILQDVVVLLEKTVQFDTKNKDAKEVLLTVYKALEMKDKAKALQTELGK